MPKKVPLSKNRFKCNITQRQKFLIEFLHTENGLDAEEIRNHDLLRREDGSRILKKTVIYWLDRFKKTGEMNTMKRSGRPRVFDEEKEKNLIEYISSNSKKNYQIVKRTKNLMCTRRTINNYALRNGIKAYRALKKPALTEEHKRKRLQFVEEWLQREEDAKKIIFTDEKLFHGQPTNFFQLVRRKKGERYEEDNINHQMRPRPALSTNVWCYIGPFGKGEIFLAENDEYFDELGRRIKKGDGKTVPFFNAKSYRNLLAKRAIPSIRWDMQGSDDFLFMQDNASIHSKMNKDKTDTLVNEVFKREGITCIKWPPLSPDLNPIENVHHLLQVELNEELARQPKMPKDKYDVFRLLKECWLRVDEEKVINIYNSFYKRLGQVKEKQGSNNY